MKTIKINVGADVYKIVQIKPTINLYKILHQKGYFEITKDPYNGKWKILMQNNQSEPLPIHRIGQEIEEKLMA